MKVAALLETRRENWKQLEQLCGRIAAGGRGSLGPRELTRFAALYRAACADLALAESYQLPPNTVQYLHRLVGRAHNQMYRSRRFELGAWTRMLIYQVPKRIFNDRCVQLAFVVFWGIFIVSAYLASAPKLWPGYAEEMLTESVINRLENDFKDPPGGGASGLNVVGASFYIRHNTGIGLKCFASGLLVIPGLFVTIFNAAHLGACFGYMARGDVAEGKNFFNFVTAHGPFELTAIVLSAGAGLRLGLAWIAPGIWTGHRTLGGSSEEEATMTAAQRDAAPQLSRSASLRATAEEAMPLMGAAMILFFFAAFIEAFISPTAIPYAFKATVAMLSSGLLMFYFIVLGYPWRELGQG